MTQLLGSLPLLPRPETLTRPRQGLILLRPDAHLPSSYTHAMTRLLPPTPIEELRVLAANPNLTSYTHPMTRLLPPAPIAELVLTANPNLTSYTHCCGQTSICLLPTHAL